MKQIHFAKNILKLDGANASRIAKRVGRSPSTVRKWMRDGIPKSAEADCVKAIKRASGIGHQQEKKPSGIGHRQEKKPSGIGHRQEKSRSPKPEARRPKKSARIPQAPVRGKGRKTTPDLRPPTRKTTSVVRPLTRKSTDDLRPPKTTVGSRKSAVGSQKSSVGGQKTVSKSPHSGRKVPKKTVARPPRGRQQAISSRASVISQKKQSGRKPIADVRLPSARSGRLPKPDARRPAPTWEPGTFVPLTEREKNEQRHQKQLAEEEFERLSLLLNHVKALKLASDVRKSGVNGMRRVYRLHGKNKNQRQTLYDMIDNEDEAWVKFYEMCEEMGMSEPEIRSSWFSPK